MRLFRRRPKGPGNGPFRERYVPRVGDVVDIPGGDRGIVIQLIPAEAVVAIAGGDVFEWQADLMWTGIHVEDDPDDYVSELERHPPVAVG